MTLAKRLIKAREGMHLSQAKLGKQINAAQSTVASWENGKNEPDLATICRLAKALNRTPEWLAFDIGGNFDTDITPIEEIDCLARVRADSGSDAATSTKPETAGRYYFPKSRFRFSFGCDPTDVKILEVVGDSMAGTLSPGEKVLINTKDLQPSPPGIFVIWDGFCLVLKRIEYIRHSDPPRVKITSDNPLYEAQECSLSDAQIQGRVIASWQRR